MRKFLFAVIALLILAAVSVLADTPCNDEDSSPVGGGTIEDYIEDADTVEYGLTDKTDECVSNRDGYHKDPSSWVREYYCANVSSVIQRTHKDIDCVREGYTKCEAGRCTGKDSPGTTSTSTPAVAAQPKCGDGKLQKERGEQCESPDDICYLNDQIGICTRPNAQGLGGCQCKLYKGGSATTETPPPAETPPPEPPAEKVEEQQPAEEAPPAETPAPEETPVAEEREPLPDYDEGQGIGVTRSITNGVKRFFRWIGSWFE